MRGSIVSLPRPVDAVVSSDDNYLSHGGGVSEAIWIAGGPALASALAGRRPQLRLGDVFASPAGALKSRTLLHAITIDLDEGTTLAAAGVATLYRRVLSAAEEQACTSVALPLLAARAAGLDTHASAEGFATAVRAWSITPSCLRRIVLVDINEEAVTCAADAVETLAGESEPPDALADALARLEGQTLGRRLREVWRQLARPGTAAEPSAGAGYAVLFETSLRLAAWAMLHGRATVVGTVSPALGSVLLQALGQAGFADVEGVVESRPVRDVVQFVPIAAQLTGAAAAPDLATTLRRAALTYDRLAAEVRVPPSVEQRDTIAAAVEQLLLLAAGAAGLRAKRGPLVLHATAPYLSSEVLCLHDEVAGSDVRSLVQRSSSDLPDAAAGVSSAGATGRANGTEHVRRLHEFLLTHLDEQSLGDLDARLCAEGYKGDPRNRLLEKCIRVEDPVELVRDEFSHAQLARIASEVAGASVRAGATKADIARLLLDHLGFPRRRRPVGLAALLDKLRRVEARLPLATASEARRLASDLARDLEFVTIVLARFLAQAAFREPPEALLRRWKVLGSSQSLSHVGLGTLFHLVQAIDDHLEDDTSAMTEVFKGLIRRRRVFPADVKLLADVRNAFTHYRDNEDSLPAAATQAGARDFVAAARAFLEYLAEPDSRLFPHIILVDGIRVDEWGRRVVEATDDTGEPHAVFTDAPLEPGQVYFMRPLTNPLRVDPILVPAGQLAWPEV